MSHFTKMKTRFYNLFYLEKALSQLEIKYKKQNVETDSINLVINQSNDHDITFGWNGQEYELIVDMSYWKQPYTIEKS